MSLFGDRGARGRLVCVDVVCPLDRSLVVDVNKVNSEMESNHTSPPELISQLYVPTL